MVGINDTCVYMCALLKTNCILGEIYCDESQMLETNSARDSLQIFTCGYAQILIWNNGTVNVIDSTELNQPGTRPCESG